MAQILEVKTTFSNFSGAPGYNQLYFGVTGDADHNAQNSYDAAFAFWNNVVVQMSEGISFAVQSDVREISDTDGTLSNIWGVTPSTQSNFASAGAYAGGSGAVVTWNTSATRGQTRLRGRTFIVPLGGAAYQSDGTLSATALTAINLHAANLATDADSDLRVWGRPSTVLGAGVSSSVVSRTVRDHVAQLRSRRD